jgi:hypothetical protein
LLAEKLCPSPGPVDHELKHDNKNSDRTVEGVSMTNPATPAESNQ